MKIGVFDSGIGGLTVLSEIRKRLGAVDYVYLGDTAHLPYGTKSPAQVERLSVKCAKTLKDKNIDVLVVACNTASSLALDSIRKEMGATPVYGMVEPGVEAALSALELFEKEAPTPRPNKAPILVLATRATVRSGAYGESLKKHLFPQAAIQQACPLLVPMIEEGWVDHPILHDTLAVYVKPYLLGEPGVALLGCTHYPWIEAAIQKSLPGWKVVNSASAIASSLEQTQFKVTQVSEEAKSRSGLGRVEWIFTDPEAVPTFARKMIEAIQLEEK